MPASNRVCQTLLKPGIKAQVAMCLCYCSSLMGCNMGWHSGWMTQLQPWILCRPVACCIATFLLGYVSDDIAVAGFKQKLVEFGPCTQLTGVTPFLYRDTHLEIRVTFHLQQPSGRPHWEEWEKLSWKGCTKACHWKTFSLAVSPHHIVRLPLTQSCLLQAFTPFAAPFSKCLFSLAFHEDIPTMPCSHSIPVPRAYRE